MEFILRLLIIILAICFVSFLLPAIIGIMAGISLIKGGSVIGGIIAIVVGIGVNVIMLYGSGLEGRLGYSDGECPYCGSGDTDGNHCYTCDDDF